MNYEVSSGFTIVHGFSGFFPTVQQYLMTLCSILSTQFTLAHLFHVLSRLKNTVCMGIDHPFHFLFSQQVPAASIDMIPRHSFSRWLTSQAGHL